MSKKSSAGFEGSGLQNEEKKGENTKVRRKYYFFLLDYLHSYI